MPPDVVQSPSFYHPALEGLSRRNSVERWAGRSAHGLLTRQPGRRVAENAPHLSVVSFPKEKCTSIEWMRLRGRAQGRRYKSKVAERMNWRGSMMRKECGVPSGKAPMG